MSERPIFASTLANDIRDAIETARPLSQINDLDFWNAWVAGWMLDRGLQLVGRNAPTRIDYDAPCVCGKSMSHRVHNDEREHVWHPYHP